VGGGASTRPTFPDCDGASTPLGTTGLAPSSTEPLAASLAEEAPESLVEEAPASLVEEAPASLVEGAPASTVESRDSPRSSDLETSCRTKTDGAGPAGSALRTGSGATSTRATDGGGTSTDFSDVGGWAPLAALGALRARPLVTFSTFSLATFTVRGRVRVRRDFPLGLSESTRADAGVVSSELGGNM
jgi:hypothetical protein